MARIPLLEQSFVKLPSIAVQTPNIDSTAGYAEIARGVARFGEGVAGLFAKKQGADDLREQLDFDMELDNESLEFEKWKNQPENLNRPDSDYIPHWEKRLEERLPAFQEKITNANVSAETKYKLEQKLNNWSSNMRTNVYSSAFQRTGDAFKGSLDLMRNSAINSNDPTKMDRYTEYVRDGISRGIFTEEQGSLMLEDASNVKNTIGQNAFKNNLENFINADQYELAYRQIDDAEKNGFINPNEAQNYRSNVKYRYEYSNKLDNAQTEAVEKPDEFLNKLNAKGTTVAPPVNAPSELSPYIASFQKYGEEYGIDPNFLMAVSMFETGNGKSNAFKNKNNATGISDNSGPRTMTSVDESIRIAAKAISNYKANTIEGIGAIYSPPGASNDPNQTNSEWPSSVRAKYQELTGVELPKDYNPKKYSSTGFSPNDEFKLKNIATQSLYEKANDNVKSLKQAIDIGQLNGQNIENIITSDPAYKTLNFSDPNIQTLKSSLIEYQNNTDFRNKVVSNGFYSDLETKVYEFSNKYNQAATDEERKNLRVQEMNLFGEIELKTNGEGQTRLKDLLRKNTETSEGKRVTGITSDAFSVLNKQFKEGKIIPFKTTEPKFIQIEKPRGMLSTKTFNEEIIKESANVRYLFPGEKTYRLAKPTDIGQVIPTSVEVPLTKYKDKVTYTGDNGEIIEVKPDKIKNNIQFEEVEDAEKRQEAELLMSQIKDNLMAEIRLGNIKTREQSVNYVNSQIGKNKPIGLSGLKNPSSTQSDAAKKRMEELLKANP